MSRTEITTAVRTVQIGSVRVREGDYIGLINGNLTVAGPGKERVIRDTLGAWILHSTRF